MKEIIISITIIGGATITFATGIYAGTYIEIIQAYINRDIKFSVDKEAWVPLKFTCIIRHIVASIIRRIC
ncbi:hypothetical protein QFZ77_006949 [Paenibacillus sp. V4I3]|uniref:hypothetical protein n=1 Tax=Paenibacillus sp. V4I3 TaxID=3042305 RepID=UPI002781E10F|nr:hypothetical protein [Paenibacillus sp. V4I3]MDQ0878290.1 hypothetical protein [Paenibacillus sp. V4I3]